jgi:hypothetical protein
LSFIWNLLSRPTHCIRVRIAEVVYNTSKPTDPVAEKKERYLTNFLDTLGEDSAMTSSTDTLTSLSDQPAEVNAEEKRILDKVGEALARLGRVKRVGLTVKDKAAFIDAWSKRKR